MPQKLSRSQGIAQTTQTTTTEPKTIFFYLIMQAVPQMEENVLTPTQGPFVYNIDEFCSDTSI